MILIGLSGKCGTGKSTIAKALASRHNLEVLSFATKLKQVCQELYPDLMTKPKEEYRKVLQTVGDTMRQTDPNVWIDPITNQIYTHFLIGQTDEWRGCVIDDMRYLNEFLTLRRLSKSFTLVRLHRGVSMRARDGYDIFDMHPSETGLDALPVGAWDCFCNTSNDEYPFEKSVRFIEKELGLKTEMEEKTE